MRDYPGMPLGKIHQVLCVACGLAVTTEYAYDERRCGYTTTTLRPDGGKRVHVSCTNPEGNNECGGGVHFDRYIQLSFRYIGGLRRGITGDTGRP